MTVIDVTEATFDAEVLERSKETPVLVDFWAEWCGPCRALTPILEREVAKHDGKVVLAKVNTDENPRLSQVFKVQGIPNVKAFKDGRIVDEFTGAQGPQMVERFLAGLVPSEAETLAAAGDEASLRRAVELEPGRADAAVPLARILHGRGETDDALELLGNVSGSFAADGLGARIRLEADPSGLALEDAWAALDAGERERAVDLVLDVMPSAGDRKDDLRMVVVGVLDELGVEHPFARDARRRLASALY